MTASPAPSLTWLGHGPSPRASIIEIVERHDGPRHPLIGNGSILLPNHMRINGVPVWATEECPAVLREVEIDGHRTAPFQVTVRLAARSLHLGEQPARNPLLFRRERDRHPVPPASSVGAVVEIPDTETLPVGERIDRPYVWLNGTRVWIEGGIVLGQLGTYGSREVAVVSLTLLVRRLVVDDEVPAPDPPRWWNWRHWF